MSQWPLCRPPYCLEFALQEPSWPAVMCCRIQRPDIMIASAPINTLLMSLARGDSPHLMLTVCDAITRTHALAISEFTTLCLRLLKLVRVIEVASPVRL